MKIIWECDPYTAMVCALYFVFRVVCTQVGLKLLTLNQSQWILMMMMMLTNAEVNGGLCTNAVSVVTSVILSDLV